MEGIFARNPAALVAALLVAATVTPMAFAADPAPAIVGKDDWIFYRYEMTDASDAGATDATVDLIRRFNKVLVANGVTMAFTMVPLKARIYARYLPAEITLNPFMAANYDRLVKNLKAGQVRVIDLNTAFLNSPKRDSDSPLYIRLDTHWAPNGAMLAAETLRAGIDADPVLKKILDAVPEQKFILNADNKRFISESRDLVEQLPKGSANFAQERLVDFSVSKGPAAGGSLLGDSADPAITLMGSSYSRGWTRFAESLRYTLQRDILTIAVGADQGSWIGMESYLMDDAFQTKKPKLIIWEMPERDMRAPPNYQYREARYLLDNTEWLLRASAWVQSSCAPSAVSAKIIAGGPARAGGAEVKTGATSDADFIRVNFEKPMDKLDYLSAHVSTAGSKSIVLEASGAGENTRKFTVAAAGDGAMHVLKSPLPGAGAGFTKLRIFPGKSSGFAMKDLRVCRQPEDLLK